MKHHSETPSNSEARANNFPWPPILFAIAVLAAIAAQRFFPVAWPGLDDWAAQSVGLAFGGIGIILIAWAIVELRRHDTTILPDGVSEHLVTSGPFRRFRNPIYLGEAFLLLGSAELTKNIWFVAALPAFVLLITFLQILPEERHLLSRFGDAYADYKQNSRRWL